MITVPGAPGGMRPGAPDNRVFIDKIETFDETWQRTILKAYAALGCTDLVIGAGFGNYQVGGVLRYPTSDWRQPAQVDALFRAVAIWTEEYHGTLSLTVAPDTAPWWIGSQDGWDLRQIDADFGDVYVRLLQTGAVRKLRSAWELYARGLPAPGETFAPMGQLFQYMVSLVDRARLNIQHVDISFHAADAHPWPGNSDEDEHGVALEGFRAGCNVIDAQYPPDQTDEQAIYDTKDCVRRLTGQWVYLDDGKYENPWGNTTPLLDCFGRPVQFDASEWKAEPYFKFEHDVDQAELNRCATMLIEAGARESGDGVPVL